MIDPAGKTLGAAFEAAARRWPDAPFLIAPADDGRAWDPDGRTLTYGAAAEAVPPMSWG